MHFVKVSILTALQWKVRRSLAFSIHEIAKILTTEITEQYLLSTFDLFLQDSDEVCEITNLVCEITVDQGQGRRCNSYG